ncbi:hypothetical protein BgiBS90_013822 [Biomphalaria glabrata]|nr:hypothetical protein BgiBS90_013822 [Biomphalaria glabrata]
MYLSDHHYRMVTIFDEVGNRHLASPPTAPGNHQNLLGPPTAPGNHQNLLGPPTAPGNHQNILKPPLQPGSFGHFNFIFSTAPIS